jgi:hypothetical protein
VECLAPHAPVEVPPVLTGITNGTHVSLPSPALSAIMAGFGQYSAPYDSYALEVTWRLSYAIGLIPLIGILLYRIFRLRESTVWQKKREALKAMGGAVVLRVPMEGLEAGAHG